MKIKNIYVLLIASLLMVLTVACSDNTKKVSEPAPKAKAQVDSPLIPKQARDALNAARGVQNTVDKADAKLQQEIDDPDGNNTKKEGQQ